jgi:hypothetical protein
MKRWLKALLVGFASSFTGSSAGPIELLPVLRESEDLDRSLADCSCDVGAHGLVRYTYTGPMIPIAEAGTINRTHLWKVVQDRDFRNRCVNGTGFSEFVQTRTVD